MPRAGKHPEASIIPCRLAPELLARVEKYAEELSAAAPHIGSHGLSEEEFRASGLFESAIEKLRGVHAASTAQKKQFIADILDALKSEGLILEWKSAESKDRHDFEVFVDADWTCVIEAKGCLDGNNTNIFVRPPNAREFIIWSLCQNPAADPRKNVRSGIHTRLTAEIIARKQLVDGLVVWDNLCGGAARPCPKLEADPGRATLLGHRKVPPPCIYLFPLTVPDPRNNPRPPIGSLGDRKFLALLHRRFHGGAGDVTLVRIEAQMKGADICRKTVLEREGQEVFSSPLAPVKRAR